MVASLAGHLDVVKALLNKNAKADIQDYAGHTATMRAIINGHISVANVLLDNNAKT